MNLVSNVLDVPDLFWEEGQANVRALYDAVRDYMEIGECFFVVRGDVCSKIADVGLGVRVGVLNEKLAVASDLVSSLVSLSCLRYGGGWDSYI